MSSANAASTCAFLKASVTIQQGVPRGLQGPLAGCGVSPPFSLTPPPEAAQEKGDLNSYVLCLLHDFAEKTSVLKNSCMVESKGIRSTQKDTELLQFVTIAVTLLRRLWSNMVLCVSRVLLRM